MNKNLEIQKMRVLAILLVVIGHSIIIYSSDWNLYTTNNQVEFLNIIKKFINIVQMPLFFIISGYLYKRTCEKYSYSHIIEAKIKRILVPFISTIMLWMVPIRIVANYEPYQNSTYINAIKNAIIGIDSGHLWYLPTIFALFIIIYPINKLSKEKRKIKNIITIFLGILSILSYKMPGILFISSICEYLFYFYIGFLFEKNNQKENKIFNISIIVVTIILNIITIFYIKNEILVRILRLITAIFEIYSICIICKKVKMNKIIEIIDKNSFAIYLLHSPLIYLMYENFANINPMILVISNIVISITTPILIANILRRIKLNFLIGEGIK